MKTRQFLRTDLPRRRRWSSDSLHIPVLLKNEKRYVCDIHFANEELCYLENAKGVPSKIDELQFIIDKRSKEDIRREIQRKQKKTRRTF